MSGRQLEQAVPEMPWLQAGACCCFSLFISSDSAGTVLSLVFSGHFPAALWRAEPVALPGALVAMGFWEQVSGVLLWL